MFFDQGEFDIRCEWGMQGVESLSPDCDVVIIVDVLSFSTSVDVAISRGASVYPYRWRDQTAVEYARSLGALLAGSTQSEGYSLSPTSLLNIPPDIRLVLPSPNGATLSLATGDKATFTGCLRNAQAVALAAQKLGGGILVAPAGERWANNRTLRPAFEDLVGSGAIIHYLEGTKSPESVLAEAAFLNFREKLLVSLLNCSSGKELVEKGLKADVEVAAAFNVSSAAPRFMEGCYTRSVV